MDTAFGWLGKIIEWFGRFIPILVVVRATHNGVKFIRGSRIKKMLPGLHVYWPLTTEIELIPVVRQTKNLFNQVLVTRDQKTVSAGIVIVYTIEDVIKAIGESWDINDTIIDISQAALISVITKMNLPELISEITDKVENELSKTARAKLKPYGVAVIRCALTDLSPCRTIKLMGDK